MKIRLHNAEEVAAYLSEPLFKTNNDLTKSTGSYEEFVRAIQQAFITFESRPSFIECLGSQENDAPLKVASCCILCASPVVDKHGDLDCMNPDCENHLEEA